jgi:CDP-4-dehydro-6-deoxyglucose reductase, E3
MVSLTLGDLAIDMAEGQTVLAALLASGIDAPYSCREGVCQTCLHQAIEGTVPEAAQIGLSDTQKEQGYFMACVCVPKESLKIIRAGDLHGRIEVTVAAIDRLSPSVIRLRLQPDGVFTYRPGQFLALTARGGVTRNYSIASQPDVDGFIELHVRILQGGRMSGLIAEQLAPNDRLEVSKPSGMCFYGGADPERPMVLAGAGTGLAPLWGILRDAIEHKHRGPIRLYHGAREQPGLYLVDELRALADRHDNFCYCPCVMSETAPYGGDLAATVLATETDPTNTDFFLCGDASLVGRLKRDLFLKGAKLQKIRADIFLPAAGPLI